MHRETDVSKETVGVGGGLVLELKEKSRATDPEGIRIFDPAVHLAEEFGLMADQSAQGTRGKEIDGVPPTLFADQPLNESQMNLGIIR